jgi:ADP-heptose:LPS heptosyltransferase
MREISVDKNDVNATGKNLLDLPQMWNLLSHASCLVCPDTGLAHMGRLIGVPTITLFGPCSPVLYGGGKYWENSKALSMWNQSIPCRNQNLFFGRKIQWVEQCWRDQCECEDQICMKTIRVSDVLSSVANYVRDYANRSVN